jgi:hypothetical protein
MYGPMNMKYKGTCLFVCLFVAFCSENRRPPDDGRRYDDDTQNLFGKLINLCLMYSVHVFVVYLTMLSKTHTVYLYLKDKVYFSLSMP